MALLYDLMNSVDVSIFVYVIYASTCLFYFYV